MITNKHIFRYGCFSIRQRVRYSTRHIEGLRSSWTEFQVWRGRKLLARHDHLLAAEQDAQARFNAFWDEQARLLPKYYNAQLAPDPSRMGRSVKRATIDEVFDNPTGWMNPKE